MWSGFEWENKVTVHTNIGDLRDYLHHLVAVSLKLPATIVLGIIS